MKTEISNFRFCKPEEFSLWLRAIALSQSGETIITTPWHSKIDIYPHQIETVIKAVDMGLPKVILADEVGLGKTIEAIMIIKELIKRKKANNFLVIVPANLVKQWHQEMLNKFDISCEIINRSNLQKIFQNEIYGGYIISADFAKYNSEVISSVNWDIVVFDEAHHIRRHFSDSRIYGDSTKRYELAEALKGKVKSILFLTATPFQLNDFEFFSLIELLDSELFEDYDHFKYYRETYLPKINEIIHAILKNEDCTQEAELLVHRLRSNFPKFFTDDKQPDGKTLIEVLQQADIIKKFVIRHKKRIEFPNLPPRQVHTITVDYTAEESRIYQEISEYAKTQYHRSITGGQRGNGLYMVILQQLLTSSPKALLSTFQKKINNLGNRKQELINNPPNSVEEEDEGGISEKIIEDFPFDSDIDKEINTLQVFIEKLNALKKDTKLESLIKLISEILVQNPNEKVIIFTRFLATQEYIRRILSQHFKVTIFNGDLSDEEKEINIDKFRNNYQVLISSEAGGEGRNLQFSHIMMNYDLPWNPVKLEQRIGRIDRIGQTKPVLIYNFSVFDTVEQKILDMLYSRINDFQDLFGEMDPMIGTVEKNITELIMKNRKLTNVDVQSIEISLEEKIEKAKVARQSFDRLMVFEKPDRDKTALIMNEANKISENKILEFVINSLSHIENTHIIDVGDNIYEIRLPKGFSTLQKDEVLVCTPFKQVAMNHPKVEFLTSEHWLVKKIADYQIKNRQSIISGDISREGKPYIDLIFKVIQENGTKFTSLRFFELNFSRVLDNFDIFLETKTLIDENIINKISKNSSLFNQLIEKAIMEINKIFDFKIQNIELVGLYCSNFDRWGI